METPSHETTTASVEGCTFLCCCFSASTYLMVLACKYVTLICRYYCCHAVIGMYKRSLYCLYKELQTEL